MSISWLLYPVFGAMRYSDMFRGTLRVSHVLPAAIGRWGITGGHPLATLPGLHTTFIIWKNLRTGSCSLRYVTDMIHSHCEPVVICAYSVGSL